MKRSYWNGTGSETVTEITERYGSHVLTIIYRTTCVMVSVKDISCIRSPLIFSMTTTIAKANAYLNSFKTSGYVKELELAIFANV